VNQGCEPCDLVLVQVKRRKERGLIVGAGRCFEGCIWMCSVGLVVAIQIRTERRVFMPKSWGGLPVVGVSSNYGR
jgi:hypothetical protein